MTVKFFNPRKAYLAIKPEIDAAMQDVLSRGDLILRKDVEQFEENLAKFVGTEYAVALNSGTDALYLALKACDIGPGDEVITVSHTFIATIEAIVRCGAKPILVDIGDDYLMDMEEVKKAITYQTKAIIPVHLSGDIIKGGWQSKDMVVIDDAAQAFGVIKNPLTDIQCWSFYPAKILGASGDAGAITTNSVAVLDYVRRARNHFYVGKAEYDGRKVGYGINSRMDNLQAAILNVKMKYVKRWIHRRSEIAEMYNKGFDNDFPLTQIILPSLANKERVWQDYVIRVPIYKRNDLQEISQRDRMADFLSRNGIETMGKGMIPNHFYDGLGLEHYHGKLPKTEQYTKEFLRLPCNETLLNSEVYYVIEKVKEFFNG